MTATVVEGIGRLITNDADLGLGPTGELRDAWLVMADGVVVATGEGAAPAADERIDAAGRCVLPGFVDSHSHLVFAGDRADEFAARMAGQPYSAGGIRTTVDATRAASDADLLADARRLRDEAARSGTTTIEIKSGYGLTADRRGPVPAGRGPADGRDHLPRRPRRPARVRGPGRRLRGRGLRPHAGGLRPPRPLGRRLLRGGRLRRRPEPDRVGSGSGAPGSASGCTPTSSAPAPACSSPSSWAARRPTTAPT